LTGEMRGKVHEGRTKGNGESSEGGRRWAAQQRGRSRIEKTKIQGKGEKHR
jgi:hypothetical protein